MGGYARAKERIRQVARERLGLDHLRPGQEAAIRAVVGGRDTLAVMPTGAGKSAIYQAAASMLPGPTIVVSPLIALQRDQVEAIEAEDVGQAAQVNSGISAAARRDAFAELAAGELEFLFLAPEQLANPETLERVRAAKPSLFVVDEAHCVTEWGHDFRPEYLRLGVAIADLDHPTVLALTATAAPPVRQEIVERLGMREPLVLVRGFDRPNIWLGVESFPDEDEKRLALRQHVREAEKPGIVYAATRRRAEEVAAALARDGQRALAYHAGLTKGQREAAQDQFMADAVEVIVATTAFGMGIDKPNVRFVFHYDVSDSLDAYYQEIGRAGRDGEPAEAVLFYRPEDLGLRRFFAGGGQVDLDQVERVAEAVQQRPGPVDPRLLLEETELSQTKLTAALNRLADADAIAFLPTGEVVARRRGRVDLTEAVEQAVEAQEQHHKFAQSRIEMMRGYAEVRDCRRGFLLNYFGEEFEPPCERCDNCLAGIVVETDEAERPFPLNARVRHTKWGEGLVMRYEGDKMTVLFDTVGYRTLVTDLVLEEKLVALAE